MDLLNDKECAARLKRCCKKLVKKSTKAIHPYLHDGTATASTEIRCHSLGGPSRMSCYLTELPWRIIHTSPQKLRECEIRHTGFSHWNRGGAYQALHHRPDFAQAKRECKRLHAEHMTKTKQDNRTIPRSQQMRQRKGQAFEGIEEYDHAVDLRTGWRFRGDLPTASSSSTNWDRNIWKTSSWNSKHSSWSDDS